MSQLKGSKHYIWSLADVLGQGATGAVYKARHKHTGELFAVKTFNQMSYMRSPDVQMREFDVLRKLDHENIVRLLDIEEETSSRCEILVMELCTGGSLYNLLDDPENAYGIDENEFQRVLIDVASGMKHLRDLGIVHRDIKPGNIMRYVNEDGRSIYKLIDFGAARELQDEEHFVSLYGTEEYLFPDMYERAVLRRPSGKEFSSAVDLWSLGVTLYHVATGQLPFRPFGGRKNKDTMYQITSAKASGVISGIQSTDGGPIEWSKQLPQTCRLSHGIKRLITPILARLLESNPDRMVKFEEFFDLVKELASKQIIYVFNLSNVNLLHVYIDKTEQLAKFQELIAEQTDIRTEEQQLLFENHEFEKIVKPFQTTSTYPNTSNQNPIYLFSKPLRSIVAMPIGCNIPRLPTFNSEVFLDEDALLAKNCCAVVHFIRRVIIDVLLKQQLMSKAAKMYRLVLSRDIEHIRDLVFEFASRVDEMGKRLNLLMQSSLMLNATLTSIIKSKSNEVQLKNQTDYLKKIFQWTSIGIQKDNFEKLNHDVEEMKQEIDSLSSQVLTEVLSWLDVCGCTESHICVSKADILVSALKQTVSDFTRDRSLKKLSFNEEQIHKFDKHKMKLNSIKAVTLVQDQCYPNTKKLSEMFHSWYREACEVQQKLQMLKNNVEKVSEHQTYLTESLDGTLKNRQEKLEPLLKELKITTDVSGVKMPETAGSVSMTTSNFQYVVRPHGSKKEIRELLGKLKGEMNTNRIVASDVKNIVAENEILIRHLEECHSPNSGQASTVYELAEEPTTLTGTD